MTSIMSYIIGGGGVLEGEGGRFSEEIELTDCFLVLRILEIRDVSEGTGVRYGELLEVRRVLLVREPVVGGDSVPAGATCLRLTRRCAENWN
jgi:hypothetical protein